MNFVIQILTILSILNGCNESSQIWSGRKGGGGKRTQVIVSKSVGVISSRVDGMEMRSQGFCCFTAKNTTNDTATKNGPKKYINYDNQTPKRDTQTNEHRHKFSYSFVVI